MYIVKLMVKSFTEMVLYSYVICNRSGTTVCEGFRYFNFVKSLDISCTRKPPEQIPPHERETLVENIK